ncbi:ABC transporter ATP-binding protein [Pyxidicoccus fallax]|uniref:ABC transporter ATP-binding protein n=1 Tax=Pyxidicoccus fallax TaxID=394095 RepID=A0A848LSH1_9BACT|nr:ABC transporter ATP-binding protein [Pyxidicoccus fallax]NMO20570.1 ABC transporter ATP-binding protein [Pyxidicoccus fallax]NPC84013.1 ABC transporter ATP-binding protein [Pyxidicoccus fallax]
MSGVELSGLSFRHGRGPDVLDQLSLEARPGEVLGVLGVNGAGKTTLFRLIAGLLKPRVGQVRVGGVDVVANRSEASRRLGFVPDEPLLYPRLSALENLNQFAVLWGVPAAEARPRAEALLRETGLWEERNAWVEGYSRGMRQKVAICCALLHRPSVLVLDEPFNGLDMGAALWLRELLRARASAGDCILLSQHQPEVFDALVDRLAVLHQGRVVELLDRAEVARRGGTGEVFQRVRGAEGPHAVRDESA